MVGDIEIGNDITERGSIEGKEEGAQDRTSYHYFLLKKSRTCKVASQVIGIESVCVKYLLHKCQRPVKHKGFSHLHRTPTGLKQSSAAC